jgi:hypothetical protein
MNGKSKANGLPFGIRRKKQGQDMAPRSLRRKGKIFLSECSEEELKKAKIVEA